MSGLPQDLTGPDACVRAGVVTGEGEVSIS